MGKLYLSQIIERAGMSSRAEYYSGRDANPGDLGADRMLKIHEGIKANYGDDAAKAFVLMVKDLSTLGACPFLQALHSLGINDFVYTPRETPPKIDVARNNADGSERTALETGGMLMASLFSASRGDPRVDRRTTQSMRNEFLRGIGESVPLSEDEYLMHRMERMRQDAEIERHYGRRIDKYGRRY